ncbi:MAG: hypothetical protein ACRCS6_06895 [Turicibacter sp.]
MNVLYIQIAAVIIGCICFSMSIFQFLLALGLPLGEFAWGGQYKVLPRNLRIGSFISIFTLIFIGVIFLAKANLVNVELNETLINVCSWVFTGFLGLNTLGNFASKSKKEKFVMGPITIVATLAGLIIAIGG